MQIGDVVAVYAQTLSLEVEPGTKKEKPIRGRVIYIHPKHRFYTVEFQFKFGKVRECFSFPIETGGYKHENNRNHERQGRRR